jgi:hypothetical protein
MTVQLFQTMMGKKLYEGDIPRAVSALERIAQALDRMVELEEAAARPQPGDHPAPPAGEWAGGMGRRKRALR